MDAQTLATQKDFIRGQKPKILYLDLEISPALIFAYRAYQTDALKIKVPPKIVSFAWQWEGQQKIHARILPDYAGYKPGILNLDDKKISQELYEVMEEADVLVGHNFKRFDLKQAKARFFFNGMAPTKKWVVEDTLAIAHKYFAFIKNNLDYISEESGDISKTKQKHSDLIWGCLEGVKSDWEGMRRYNKRDIVLTRNRYKSLAPWHETHANLNLYYRREDACPVCLSQKIQRRGIDWNKTSGRYKYTCTSCGHWWRGERIEKEIEPVIQANI